MQRHDGPGGPRAPEERLAEAQAADPEAAAAIAPRPPRRRAGLALAMIGAGLLLVLGFGMVARCLRGGPPAAPGATSRAGVPGSALPPIRAHRDAVTGQQLAPFQGFAVSVETDPPGGLVSVDGIRRGEAPALAGVDCEPGDEIVVSAQRRGGRPVRTRIECRENTLVKLTLRTGD